MSGRLAIEAGYDACRVATRRAGSSFWAGIRLLPEDRRAALCAVYWFAAAADRAVDAEGATELRRERLSALERDLEATFDGDPPDARWAALADAAQRYGIDPRRFDELLEGVGRDLDTARYPDWPALREYCHGVASVVGLIGLRIFGGGGAEAEAAAEELGYAVQLTNILRDVREDARAGRWYLPRDETERFGISPESVAEGHAGPGWEGLVLHQVERARRLYGSADPLLRRLPRATRPCPAALAAVYRGLLERIARDPRAPLRRRVRLARGERAVRVVAAAARASLLRSASP
ncbi:MAG: squalene/phytoene synthase family protein [Gemmatimonadota bacterium]|nr:squalene/phytoene synthase family protein [Gemmatimonadota bacterium]